MQPMVRMAWAVNTPGYTSLQTRGSVLGDAHHRQIKETSQDVQADEILSLEMDSH